MWQHQIEFVWGDPNVKVTTPYPRLKHGYAEIWIDEPSEKFCVVRHPATRLVSFYRYLQQFGAYQNISFSKFLLHRAPPTVPRKKQLISPWVPQSQWVMH